MTHQKSVSMPFSSDITDKDRIINIGVQKLRDVHRQRMADHAAAFDSESELAWQRAEQRRKESFLKSYREKNWFPLKFKYGLLPKEAQYRISLPRDERCAGLAAIGAFCELLYCLMSRNTTDNKTTVEQVKSWLKPYMEVDGNYKLISDRNPNARVYVVEAVSSSSDVIHASGLSKPFGNLLAETSMIEVGFGKVRWFPPEDVNLEEY
jgi:hypothetical protein